ncbi:MAG: type II secretion system protein GspG [Acidobacteria bacterium]|nr:type II secretion system protein GspG [Acidobacteriota bacterium]
MQSRGLISVSIAVFTSVFICALISVVACACLSPAAAAQKKPKKPKPALKEKDARRVIANTRGFALNTGAVSVRAVSDAGTTPVTLTAAVTTAFRFEKIEDEKSAQAGLFKVKRWRAVEFRNGDRSWEEFDLLAAALGAERIERARAALEMLLTEFETQQRERKSVEPLTRGALTIKLLSAQGSSALAEVAVEFSFRLSKDTGGKWVVEEVFVGDESSGDLNALWQTVNSRKTERARAELAVVRAALEAFRRTRGFYVVADSDAVLMDHLSTSYIERIIRLDPWHRPYRYAGTRDAYTLSSDGPDGKEGTADDVTARR